MPSLLPHDLCHGRSSSLAPSSDRIPVELFQILKDDAVESAALNMQYAIRSEEHTCELQSPGDIVCRLLLEKKNNSSTLPTRGPKRTTNKPRRVLHTDS